LLAAEKRQLAYRTPFLFQRGFFLVSLAHSDAAEAADSRTLVISLVITDANL
jgi:hypothetical protein